MDQMVFGNQPNSTITAPKTGQSICLKVYADIFQRYYLYLDDTPTLGQPNDSSGAMGWIEGIVADSSGTPLSGIEIIYDYVETDWVTTIKKSVFTDRSGYFIFREMARCLSLYYNTGEKEDHYLSRQQIWPDDTLSIQVKINYIDQLPDQEKIPGIIYFELNQNYPNPFNALTCIKFKLSRRVPVELNIYNMYGQRITTLMNEERSAGIHQATWDGRNFASGLYYYQLKAGDRMLYQKLLLIK